MSQINNEKSNLAKQNNDLTSSIEDLDAKNKKQQEENDVTQLSINDVKGKMLSTNQMLSKLTDENSKTELDISQLEINSKTYTTEIDNLQKQIKTLQQKLDSINNGSATESGSGSGSGSILTDPDGKTTSLSIDSAIVKEVSSLQFVLNQLTFGVRNIKLLYRASQGFSLESFHQSVDGVSKYINDDRTNFLCVCVFCVH